MRPISERLREAATYIRKGHTKGVLYDGQGRVCALGALGLTVSKMPQRWGFWYDPVYTIPGNLVQALARVIPEHPKESMLFSRPQDRWGYRIAEWNNMAERTGDEVAGAMEAAADLAEGDELAAAMAAMVDAAHAEALVTA